MNSPRLGRQSCSYSIQPVRLHVDHTELRHKTGRGCKGKCYIRGATKRSARNLDCGSSEMKSTWSGTWTCSADSADRTDICVVAAGSFPTNYEATFANNGFVRGRSPDWPSRLFFSACFDVPIASTVSVYSTTRYPARAHAADMCLVVQHLLSSSSFD